VGREKLNGHLLGAGISAGTDVGMNSVEKLGGNLGGNKRRKGGLYVSLRFLSDWKYRYLMTIRRPVTAEVASSSLVVPAIPSKLGNDWFIPASTYKSYYGRSAHAARYRNTVTRADVLQVLEYKWGGFDMRWELEGLGGGTRLTLWTNIGHRFIAMGAAGWHICCDVLDHLLRGIPLGRIVGPDAMKFPGWRRLNAEYTKQFSTETLNSRPQAAQKP
jgi:hypothetical protein